MAATKYGKKSTTKICQENMARNRISLLSPVWQDWGKI